MADPALLQTIAAYRKAGDSDDVIKEQLVRAGWSAEDVNGALAASKLGDLPSVSHAIHILPNSHKSTVDKKPAKWVSNLITLLLIIAFGAGLYYSYTHHEFSALDFGKFLPTSPLQNINPADYTNVVATSTPPSSP